MASLNFFAAREDQISLIEFLLTNTDLRIFEAYSQFSQELQEFDSASALDNHYLLGEDTFGNGSAILLQLWSPSIMVAPEIKRVDLDPKRCSGYTFRYRIDGGGLIRLYFGGVHGQVLTKSHYGHFTEKGAQRWGLSHGVDWAARAKLSSRIQYYVRRRFTNSVVPWGPVLPKAYDLAKQGYYLKEAVDAPWRYELYQAANGWKLMNEGA